MDEQELEVLKAKIQILMEMTNNLQGLHYLETGQMFRIIGKIDSETMILAKQELRKILEEAI